jgi:hypothetical protein
VADGQKGLLPTTEWNLCRLRFPGSPDLANRQIEEATLVAAWRIAKTENRGSVQYSTQFSWLSRKPYDSVTALIGHGQYYSATAYLVFSQLRYNLP